MIRLKVAARGERARLQQRHHASSGFRIPALIDAARRDRRRVARRPVVRDRRVCSNNISQDDGAAIPVLSSCRSSATLFKSKAERAEQTELMVLITPRLVRPLDPDEVPPLPTTQRAVPAAGRRRRPSKPVDAPPVKPVGQ